MEDKYYSYYPTRCLKRTFKEIKNKPIAFHIINQDGIIKVLSKSSSLLNCRVEEISKQNFYVELEEAKQNNKLEREKIKLPIKELIFDYTDNCVICSMLLKKEELIVAFPCKHLLHKGCGKDLISYTSKCPICRKYYI